MTYYDNLPWFPQLKACTACPCRAEAQQVVPGIGLLTAAIMVLGRNPGKDEDKHGFPLIGKSGQELDVWLEKLGLDRKKLLVTNLAKCHTVSDRKPTREEIQTCGGLWLRREFTDLPELQAVLALGAEVTQFLLGTHATPPSKLQAYAERITVDGKTLHVLPIAHPSYFLRAQGKKVPLYNSVLPRIREYLRRELPDAYARSAVTVSV